MFAIHYYGNVDVSDSKNAVIETREVKINTMERIPEIISVYKDTPGGLIEAFHAVQAIYNYLPADAISESARMFGVSEAAAYGVATFYSYLAVEPRGKYIIRMCESAPCHIAGAEEILKTFEKELKIRVGQTTPDGKFTLELTECVGHCQGTPVITINSVPYVDVRADQIPSILALCK